MLKGVRSRLMRRDLKNPVAVAALVVILVVAEEVFLADEAGAADVETISCLTLRPPDLTCRGARLERKGRCRHKRHEQTRA